MVTPSLLNLDCIPELSLRVGVAKQRLSNEPLRAARGLDHLVAEAVLGDAAARTAMLACAIAICREPDAPWVSELRAASAAHDLPNASLVLDGSRAHRTVEPHGRLPDPCISSEWVFMMKPKDTPSAGRFRWFPGARTWLQWTSRLDRLLMHPDPFVVGRIIEARSTRPLRRSRDRVAPALERRHRSRDLRLCSVDGTRRGARGTCLQPLHPDGRRARPPTDDPDASPEGPGDGRSPSKGPIRRRAPSARHPVIASASGRDPRCQ